MSGNGRKKGTQYGQERNTGQGRNMDQNRENVRNPLLENTPCCLKQHCRSQL